MLNLDAIKKGYEYDFEIRTGDSSKRVIVVTPLTNSPSADLCRQIDRLADLPDVCVSDTATVKSAKRYGEHGFSIFAPPTAHGSIKKELCRCLREDFGLRVWCDTEGSAV